MNDVVISVPAYFNDKQRQATLKAASIAGLNVLRLINEPTAAALAYGTSNLNSQQTFLVVDIGGGTFDVSILETFPGVLEVRASAGDNFLGGKYFSDALFNYCIDQSNSKLCFPKDSLTAKEESLLRKRVEQAKQTLSLKKQTIIEFEINNSTYK